MQSYLTIQFYKDKWDHAGFRRYFHNASWMFAARVVTMAVSFIATLYIARRLGPTNFGELDYAIAVVGFFGWIAAWGIEGVLNRELIKQPERRNEITGTAFLLRLVFGLAATVSAIIFAFLFPIEAVSQTAILLLAFTSLLSAPQVLQQDFYARAESKYPSLISAAVVIATNLGKILVIAYGKGVLYLAAVMVCEHILYGILYLVLYRARSPGNWRMWTFSPDIARLILTTGTATAFLSLFAMAYARIDQVMIRHFLDAHQLGLYSSAVRLIDLWAFIPGIVLASLYPAVLNARAVSEELYNARLRKIIIALATLAFSVSLVLVLAAPFIMPLIFGEAFAGGAVILQIYSLALPFVFLGAFVMQVLYTDDERFILICTTLVPALLNIALNLILIPAHGIVGAAVATVVAYPLVILIPLAFSRSRRALASIVLH